MEGNIKLQRKGIAALLSVVCNDLFFSVFAIPQLPRKVAPAHAGWREKQSPCKGRTQGEVALNFARMGLPHFRQMPEIRNDKNRICLSYPYCTILKLNIGVPSLLIRRTQMISSISVPRAVVISPRSMICFQPNHSFR